MANSNPSEDRYILLFHVWHPAVIARFGWEDEAAAPFRSLTGVDRLDVKDP